MRYSASMLSFKESKNKFPQIHQIVHSGALNVKISQRILITIIKMWSQSMSVCDPEKSVGISSTF